MIKTNWLVFLTILLIFPAACSTMNANTPPPFTPTMLALAIETPIRENPAIQEPVTPTSESIESPTQEFTPTPTSTETLTPTVTPTPVPPVPLNKCAQIWQPGYYKLVTNIKTPTNLDCLIVQTSDVVIDCDNYTIEGNTVNIKDNQYAGNAIVVRQYGFPLLQTPTNVEIKNCKILHHRFGIHIFNGDRVYIHNNDSSNNYDDTNKDRFGLFLGMTEGGGIRLDSVRNSLIESNLTNLQAIGIDIRDSANITVTNNLSEKNSAWGISVIKSTYTMVTNNTTRDNKRMCIWGDNKTLAPGCDAGGIFLYDGASHNIIKNNIITGENGGGIFIKAHGKPCGDDNLIQGNKIIDALWNGIELGFCKDNKIIGNDITGNGSTYVGISSGFDSNTEIRNNNISNMRNQGINSWNSRNTTVVGNQISNSREGVLFYWDIWDPTQFAFLAPSPDRYASRDNIISNNIFQGNSVAAIHIKDSIQDRLEDNAFSYNGKNIWLQGKTDGTIITGATGCGPSCSFYQALAQLVQ